MFDSCQGRAKPPGQKPTVVALLAPRSFPGSFFRCQNGMTGGSAVIRQRKDRDGLQVQVYAGRDPFTGRKRWVSRQASGKGRAAMKRAKQVEAELLAQIAAGQHRGSKTKTVAELIDRW